MSERLPRLGDVVTRAGDILIARLGRGYRGLGASLSPCEAYARVVHVTPLTVDVGGVWVVVDPRDTRVARHLAKVQP